MYVVTDRLWGVALSGSVNTASDGPTEVQCKQQVYINQLACDAYNSTGAALTLTCMPQLPDRVLGKQP